MMMMMMIFSSKAGPVNDQSVGAIIEDLTTEVTSDSKDNCR